MNNQWFSKVAVWMVIALVLWGSMQDLSTVFGFADVTMGLLALVNLAALFLLFKTGLRLMNDYDTQIKAGVKSPVFDPKAFADLDLDPAAWSSKPPVVDQAAMANSVYQR